MNEEASESTQRRLIRPSLSDAKNHGTAAVKKSKKRPAPPETTHAEGYYYVKQMQNRTPMVVVLNDGEELRGVIEWYDRACLKLNRTDGPNLLIYKDRIKYLFKAEGDDEEEG